MSTRKVAERVRALGIEAGISKSEVSRICASLDEQVGAFRDRSLGHGAFPYLFLDATYLKAHEGPHVVSKAVVIATGVRADGGREVLGLAVGDLRGRRLLDGLPALSARPRPPRREARHLRRP